MSYKIQITVDEQLNQVIKASAKKMGLSVSSYARFALMNVLSQKNNKLLDSALKDLASDDTEILTLEEFKHQLNNL